MSEILAGNLSGFLRQMNFCLRFDWKMSTFRNLKRHFKHLVPENKIGDRKAAKVSFKLYERRELNQKPLALEFLRLNLIQCMSIEAKLYY